MKTNNGCIGIAALALATVLAGCATTPREAPDVQRVRAEVDKAASDPLAGQAAAQQVEAARAALKQAELTARGPVHDQALYQAERNAQIADALLREARARQNVEAADQQRNRVLLEARERDAQRAKTEAERAQTEAQLAQSQARQAQGEAEATRQQAQALAAQAQASSEEASKLREQLVALNAKQTERGMVLTLPDVLFDSGKSTLNPGANSTLDRVADFLKSNNGYSVVIEGHTDSVGSEEYNQQLSERRAESVVSSLRSRGVGGDQLQARGAGESAPVTSNDTAAGRQQNRRVEIIFSSHDDKAAPRGRG